MQEQVPEQQVQQQRVQVQVQEELRLPAPQEQQPPIHLVRRHLKERLILSHRVTHLLKPAGNRSFGHRFSKQRGLCALNKRD